HPFVQLILKLGIGFSLLAEQPGPKALFLRLFRRLLVVLSGLRCSCWYFVGIGIALPNPVKELLCLDFCKLAPLAINALYAQFNWQGVPVFFDTVSGKAVRRIELGNIEEQAIVAFPVVEVVFL